MTEREPNEATDTTGKVAPETLELRARPQPVTRINRKVLIGGAAIVLLFISGIVLVALKPPSLRISQSSGALQCRAQADHRRPVQSCRRPTMA